MKPQCHGAEKNKKNDPCQNFNFLLFVPFLSSKTITKQFIWMFVKFQ